MAVVQVGTAASAVWATYGTGIAVTLPSTADGDTTLCIIRTEVGGLVDESDIAVVGAAVGSWSLVRSIAPDHTATVLAIVANGDAAASVMVTIAGYPAEEAIGWGTVSYSDVGELRVGATGLIPGDAPPPTGLVPGVDEAADGYVLLAWAQAFAAASPTSVGFSEDVMAYGVGLLGRPSIVTGPSGDLSVTSPDEWHDMAVAAIALHPAAVDPSEGAASGTVAWSGTATGEAPTIEIPTGSASGSTTWTGAATGETRRSGTADGSTTWTGAATGETRRSGTAVGTVTWTGAATGDTPTIDASEGTATGAIVWFGVAHGPSDYTGPPDERIIRIAADDRTTTIAADDRTATVPAESRTLEVSA